MLCGTAARRTTVVRRLELRRGCSDMAAEPRPNCRERHLHRARMVEPVVDVVVLLGAPGSGKSSVGERLGARGFRWREWEPLIVERWGGRERFVAAKDEALPALHREIRDWIADDGGPAVFETTGLSDSPLLAELRRSGRAYVVRLDVTEAEALRRVSTRERGRHLTDELDDNRRVWAAFHERVVPATDVDLVIDTESESIDSAVRTIITALAEREARGLDRPWR